MNDTASEKRHHRIVTLISLLIALAIYLACRFGLLGQRLDSFAPYYLAIMLVILGGRAFFIELGIRRKRFGFEQRFEKCFRRGAVGRAEVEFLGRSRRSS